MKIFIAAIFSLVAALSLAAAPSAPKANFDVGISLGAPAGAQAALSGNLHTLTVNITFNFANVPGCTSAQTTGCIKQFNVYNVTAGAKTLIFSIPAPAAAATSQVVTATSPTFAAMPGNVVFAFTAATPDPLESAAVNSTVPVPVPPPTSATCTLN